MKRKKAKRKTQTKPSRQVWTVNGRELPISADPCFFTIGDKSVRVHEVRDELVAGEDGTKRLVRTLTRVNPVAGLEWPKGIDVAISDEAWSRFNAWTRGVEEIKLLEESHGYRVNAEYGEARVRRVVDDAVRAGFLLALLRYADDLKTSAEATAMIRAEQRRRDLVLKQRRENGEILAVEGRAAKAPNDAARAKWICSAYRRIRPSKPEGSRGNGAAIRDVVERYQSPTGKSITPKGVREILKRFGVMQARRKGKN